MAWDSVSRGVGHQGMEGVCEESGDVGGGSGVAPVGERFLWLEGTKDEEEVWIGTRRHQPRILTFGARYLRDEAYQDLETLTVSIEFSVSRTSNVREPSVRVLVPRIALKFAMGRRHLRGVLVVQMSVMSGRRKGGF
jgi:hypothetical protein